MAKKRSTSKKKSRTARPGSRRASLKRHARPKHSARGRTAKAAARSPRPAARPAAAGDQKLRGQLIQLLRGGHAHLTFADAIRDMPVELRGRKPAGAAHTPWEILEHLRVTQWDIVEFSRDPEHRSPARLEDYWPQSEAPPDERAWNRSIREFEGGLADMEKLIADPRRDLHAQVDHPEAQAHHTLAREAAVLAIHNGYHIAELVTLRRVMGGWPGA